MSERCQHADTVAAYLLGALPDAERREFEAHLAELRAAAAKTSRACASSPTRCRSPCRRSRRRRSCATA